MNTAVQAGRGHLVVGTLLVAGALAAAVAAIAIGAWVLAILTFFLGVWGGVELGRCLERWLRVAAQDRHHREGSAP